MCSNRGGGEGQLDIWRVPDVDFVALTAGTPFNPSELNTDGDDCTLTQSDDGLELFWEHRALGGDWDLWTATRDDNASPWQDLGLAGEASSGFDDNDPWLLAGGHRLYFASTREGESDLYVAER